MISQIRTKGFKGQDINEEIHAKTLFVGPNGCGKSTRSHAIALVILGYVPWAAKVKKKPADILEVYGIGDTLTVSIIINNTEFERHFSRSSKGSVSQRLRVDKQKFSAADFAVALDRAGAPSIFDVSAFMDLSDQKKMDLVFNLFPPQGDVRDLDSRIDKKNTELNKLNRQLGTANGVIQRLTASKRDIEVPAGSLAEVQAEIKTLTGQVKVAQENLKAAEIENAKTAAEGETLAKVQAEKEVLSGSTSPTSQAIDNLEAQIKSPQMERIKKFVSGCPSPPDPIESIQAILDVIESAGCAACAAKLVAKRELMKFKGRTAA